jgi:hypothetical protein
MSAITSTVEIGNIGTIFEATVLEPVVPSVPDGAKQAVNLANYTVHQFEFEKPSGERLALVNATIKNGGGADGVLTYSENTGIFDDTGRWKYRPVLTTVTGSFFQGTWIGFTVGD